jgi:hypothetical protein
LGRVIHTTNPTRQRNAVLKNMASAIRNYSRSQKTDESTAELATNLINGLQEIHDSVDQTAGAWEKRDYWLKADAFRRQWSWAEKFLSGLKAALESGNRSNLIRDIQALGEKLESDRPA